MIMKAWNIRIRAGCNVVHSALLNSSYDFSHFLCGKHCFFGRFAHLIRHNGKPASDLSRPCRFYGIFALKRLSGGEASSPCNGLFAGGKSYFRSQFT
jgi:hypothetical protein